MENYTVYLLNRIAQAKHYKWDDKYKLTNTFEAISKVIENEKLTWESVLKLSFQKLKELGFYRWETSSKLILIPLWIYDLIPDGTQLHCIDGKSGVKGKDEIDLDIRFGCLAWGIMCEEIDEIKNTIKFAFIEVESNG